MAKGDIPSSNRERGISHVHSTHRQVGRYLSNWDRVYSGRVREAAVTRAYVGGRGGVCWEGVKRLISAFNRSCKLPLGLWTS